MTVAHLTALTVLLAIACASDLAERRIPNIVVALVAATGLLVQGLTGGMRGLAGGLLSGSAIVAVFAVAWVFGKVGAGDVKLLASVAIWVGPPRLIHLVLYTAVAGLPVALATRFIHRLGLWRVARTTAIGEATVVERETVPVALAITMGTVATLMWG